MTASVLALVPLLLAPGARSARRAETAPAVAVPVEDVLSVNLAAADIRDVAMHLAAFAGASVVIGPEVRGTVTITLHDVPPEQALSIILRMHGYASIREGRVIRVGSISRLLEEARYAR